MPQRHEPGGGRSSFLEVDIFASIRWSVRVCTRCSSAVVKAILKKGATHASRLFKLHSAVLWSHSKPDTQANCLAENEWAAASNPQGKLLKRRRRVSHCYIQGNTSVASGTLAATDPPCSRLEEDEFTGCLISQPCAFPLEPLGLVFLSARTPNRTHAGYLEARMQRAVPYINITFNDVLRFVAPRQARHAGRAAPDYVESLRLVVGVAAVGSLQLKSRCPYPS